MVLPLPVAQISTLVLPAREGGRRAEGCADAAGPACAGLPLPAGLLAGVHPVNLTSGSWPWWFLEALARRLASLLQYNSLAIPRSATGACLVLGLGLAFLEGGSGEARGAFPVASRSRELRPQDVSAGARPHTCLCGDVLAGEGAGLEPREASGGLSAQTQTEADVLR